MRSIIARNTKNTIVAVRKDRIVVTARDIRNGFALALSSISALFESARAVFGAAKWQTSRPAYAGAAGRHSYRLMGMPVVARQTNQCGHPVHGWPQGVAARG
jgi:hypothetical protein